MSSMTREQKIEAFTLRLDGFTFEQIAEHMGCTRQYIQGILHSCISEKRSRLDGCIFPNITECMMRTKTTLRGLYKILHPNESKYDSYAAVYIKKRLQGTTNFSAKEWLKLSNYFGMPVEKLMITEEYENEQ